MKHESLRVDCLAFQLSLARKRVMDWYQRSLTPLGLTPAYVYVLGVLNDEGGASPSRIAAALELQKPTVTDLLDRMSRDEFIRRDKDPESRRASIVTLTPKGRQICREAYKALKISDRSLDKILDGKLSHLKDQVQALNKRIRK